MKITASTFNHSLTVMSYVRLVPREQQV